MEQKEGKWEIALPKHPDIRQIEDRLIYVRVGNERLHIAEVYQYQNHKNREANGTAIANAERICLCVNGWDELQAELKLYRESRNYPEIIKLQAELKAKRKQVVQMQGEIEKLRARLETTERLVLQGGAGHDAIVEKAVKLQKEIGMLKEIILHYKSLDTPNEHIMNQINAELVKQRDALRDAAKEILLTISSAQLDGSDAWCIETTKLDEAIALCAK